jgi:hypothetical protein
MPLVSSASPRPPHPAPNVRDDRDTPLVFGTGCASNKSDLGYPQSDLFFARGLDRFSRKQRDLPVGQITTAAQDRLSPSRNPSTSSISIDDIARASAILKARLILTNVRDTPIATEFSYAAK